MKTLQDWLEELYKLVGGGETPTETNESTESDGDGGGE